MCTVIRQTARFGGCEAPVGGGNDNHIPPVSEAVQQCQQRGDHRSIDLWRSAAVRFGDQHVAALPSMQASTVHHSSIKDGTTFGRKSSGGCARSTWSALPSRVLRTGARASSSSRKIIEGAVLLACRHSRHPAWPSHHATTPYILEMIMTIILVDGFQLATEYNKVLSTNPVCTSSNSRRSVRSASP